MSEVLDAQSDLQRGRSHDAHVFNIDAVQRNSGIDLLRGLSILLVVLHHTGLRIPLKHTALGELLPKRLTDALNYNGYESVFVFFTISGFLIAGNALQRWGSLDRIDFGAFYARRFARIMPCLLLLVVVLSALDLLGFQDYLITHANQSLPRAVLAALGLYLNWYEGHTGYLPGNWDVLWSLSIEEVFYIGFPIVCVLARRTWVLVPMLIVLALSLPVTHAALASNEVWQEKAYLPGMAAIAMGVLGALIAKHFRPSSRWIATALCVIGIAGLASIFFIEDLLWPVLKDGCLLLLTFSAMCLLIALRWREDIGSQRPLRGFGWLRSFGRLSYEIYLTHMFVVYGAVRLFKALGGDMPNGWLWYVPVVLSCWLLGWLVARWYSIPSDRALRSRLLAASPRRDHGNAIDDAAVASERA
ncbi:MAG TPA: acyltransferase [Xanthomonadaceae bacterium]|nr:acyltransferase [Xanthomonadaceae bacterium]